MECERAGTSFGRQLLIYLRSSETNLDDVLQISNVFVNVSKGEVAKHGDLKKAFGTTEISDIVAEVGLFLHASAFSDSLRSYVDLEEGRGAGRREGTGTRSICFAQRNCYSGCREMCRPNYTATLSGRYD